MFLSHASHRNTKCKACCCGTAGRDEVDEVDEVFIPGLGALGARAAGLGALGADFRVAGVDVPRVAVRDSDGAALPLDAVASASLASGMGGRSAISRRGINGSLRSLATSFTKFGRTSPLFLPKWSE